MMIVETVEKQIGQLLTTAKDMQSQVQMIQKQGLLITQQGEIKAREFLHQVFDSGLTLLGQGMLTARKATESFVAETHRKADKIKAMADSAENSSDESADQEEEPAHVTPLESLNGQQKSKKQNFKGVKNKKQRAHLTNTSKSH